ncbi:REP-associated tyrosine transposase [Marinicella gelatinilytica]|uniref:REP-associated tyrosine transposase n=1 Tax=Marinicella gelatinilytica TaxID=2996017 RepID=UPI002B1F6350|nr:transposase [Marinicella gelatinilytica]
MQYRRANITGACYFFTINLADRRSYLLVMKFDVLRDVINQVKHKHPFKLDAKVIMPEHFHIMMTLPENDNDYPKRIMLIKSGFSKKIPKTERINPSRLRKRERGIWQRRYWEHLIRDEDDYQKHVDYIHYNPVKHGHAQKPSDWAYSTIHKYIDLGIYDKNWGNDNRIHEHQNFGENIP